MNVIEKIEKLRTERNWTKYRLAEESLLSYSTLASMYARETPPKVDVLEQICNAFGITLAQFFSENDAPVILSDEEKELIRIFRKLDGNKRRAILTIASETDRCFNDGNY